MSGVRKLSNPPCPPFDKGGTLCLTALVDVASPFHKGEPLCFMDLVDEGPPLVKGGLGGICFWVAALTFLLPATAFSQSLPTHIPDPLTPQSIARSRADMETRMAVLQLGASVCRELRIGIGERDWIRGVVIGVEADRVAVKIDQPGRFVHVLNGLTIVPGSVVRDTMDAWTPCL